MRLKRRQPGFFDIEERTKKLTQMGDPLIALNAHVDWEAFRADLNRVHLGVGLLGGERKGNAGTKPIDVVLKFKILVLQQLHNLSDDRIEYQIRDRLSFMRFLGLQLEDRGPDAKTVWLFREQIKAEGLMEPLFARFHEQLAAQGYAAKAGQMIDATFVEIPRQRNNRDENAEIKAGVTPEAWQADNKAAKSKLRQKDVDARWAKKNLENHYGYKNHINADQGNKLVQSYAVTAASVHDSQVFEVLLDQSEVKVEGGSEGESDSDSAQKRAIYADSAYRSAEKEAALQEMKIESQICEKGTKSHPLSEAQKESNHAKSKVRSRVEHIFGAQAQMGGHIVRTIGILRARVKIGMMNLVYNRVRLGQLIRRDSEVASAMR